MKKLKRLAALTLALAVALTVFTGCGGKKNASSSAPGSSGSSSSSSSSSTGATRITPMDLSQVTDPYLAVSGLAGDEVVAKLGNMDITAAELLYWLNVTTTNYCQYNLGTLVADLPWDAPATDNFTLEQFIMDEAIQGAVFHCLLRQMGEEEGFTPDPSISSELYKSYVNQVVQANSDEMRVIHTRWAQMLTQDLLVKYSENGDLYDQLVELYFGESSGHYPTDAEVMAWLDNNGYFRVKHILLMTVDQTTNEPLEEEVIAQKKSTADDLLAQLQAAEDPVVLFDQLMTEHSEDGGLTAYPDGYTFDATSSLVGGFREAALALSVGELSEVVETDYGYHIMLRLPIDPADYRNRVVSQLMEEKMDTRAQELGITETASLDKLDLTGTWKNILSLQAAVQAGA